MKLKIISGIPSDVQKSFNVWVSMNNDIQILSVSFRQGGFNNNDTFCYVTYEAVE